MNASYEGMDETLLLKSLRDGDEDAYAWLVQNYHASLVRLALSYVLDDALAEEVAQETWIAVLRGLDRFEGRSSLKTWIFSILTNIAKTRGQREKRILSFSESEDAFDDQPTVDATRFKPADYASFANHWVANPSSWEDIPEGTFLSRELLQVIEDAVATLPRNQRVVITLHDIDGLSSSEVCNILGISETNQRVLLHRSRAKVREVLENYLNSEN